MKRHKCGTRHSAMLARNPAEAQNLTQSAIGAGTPCVVCNGVVHDEFIKRTGYRICRCRSCGLRFLHPQPTADEIQEFYSKEYFGSGDSAVRGYDAYVADADNHRATFRKRLGQMPSPKRGDRLLDVGAAAGYFVEQAVLAGWQAEGIEPSEWAARYAQEQLRQSIRHGWLEDAHYPASAFDAVTMWEVIEHVRDPRSLLLEVARILRPDGHLVLSTPDSGSQVARVFGRRWLGWSKVPEHLYFFDRANLSRLLEESGFRVTHWSYVSITVSLAFAAKRLGALLGLPTFGRLPVPLSNLSVAVNPLYDLMIVAQRK
jgi:2-polyprenyl-3-methyl-5-hydroxy-6-metoxy-1,4-benzoquinol methylase